MAQARIKWPTYKITSDFIFQNVVQIYNDQGKNSVPTFIIPSSVVLTLGWLYMFIGIKIYINSYNAHLI